MLNCEINYGPVEWDASLGAIVGVRIIEKVNSEMLILRAASNYTEANIGHNNSYTDICNSAVCILGVQNDIFNRDHGVVTRISARSHIGKYTTPITDIYACNTIIVPPSGRYICFSSCLWVLEYYLCDSKVQTVSSNIKVSGPVSKHNVVSINSNKN